MNFTPYEMKILLDVYAGARITVDPCAPLYDPTMREFCRIGLVRRTSAGPHDFASTEKLVELMRHVLSAPRPDPGRFSFKADDVRRDILRQFSALPREGKPAANLTDRDKLALASACGVPTELAGEGMTITLRSAVPFSVADSVDGGYIVGWRSAGGGIKTVEINPKP